MNQERQDPPRERGARSVVVGDSSHSLRRATVNADADTVVVRGRGVRDALRRAGMRPLYAGSVGGHMLDRKRLDDILVVLERMGYAVMLEDSAPSVPTTPTSTPAMEQSRELGLW